MIKKTKKPRKDFAKTCLLFVDRNGTVLDKGSNPYSSFLRMDYKEPGLSMHIHCTQSPYGNGYCLVKATVNKKLVFEAEGGYIGGPYDLKIKTYVPGAWEKKIK